jgi:hypothetical protein
VQKYKVRKVRKRRAAEDDGLGEVARRVASVPAERRLQREQVNLEVMAAADQCHAVGEDFASQSLNSVAQVGKCGVRTRFRVAVCCERASTGDGSF